MHSKLLGFFQVPDHIRVNLINAVCHCHFRNCWRIWHRVPGLSYCTCSDWNQVWSRSFSPMLTPWTHIGVILLHRKCCFFSASFPISQTRVCHESCTLSSYTTLHELRSRMSVSDRSSVCSVTSKLSNLPSFDIRRAEDLSHFFFFIKKKKKCLGNNLAVISSAKSFMSSNWCCQGWSTDLRQEAPNESRLNAIFYSAWARRAPRCAPFLFICRLLWFSVLFDLEFLSLRCGLGGGRWRALRQVGCNYASFWLDELPWEGIRSLWSILLDRVKWTAGFRGSSIDVREWLENLPGLNVHLYVLEQSKWLTW